MEISLHLPLDVLTIVPPDTPLYSVAELILPAAASQLDAMCANIIQHYKVQLISYSLDLLYYISGQRMMHFSIPLSVLLIFIESNTSSKIAHNNSQSENLFL